MEKKGGQHKNLGFLVGVRLINDVQNNGCTVPPDAARCPNCSYKYADSPVKMPPKSNGNGIIVSCVGYATKCEVHGKIYIRATMASAPTRWPIC